MKNARFCRICLRSLDENCYLLCKIRNEGLTAAGHALFHLTKIDSRNEVRGKVHLRGFARVATKERLARSRSFFFGTKPQPESSGPMPSRIPTPTRSPSCKSENVRKKVDVARGLRSSSPSIANLRLHQRNQRRYRQHG